MVAQEASGGPQAVQYVGRTQVLAVPEVAKEPAEYIEGPVKVYHTRRAEVAVVKPAEAVAAVLAVVVGKAVTSRRKRLMRKTRKVEPRASCELASS